MMSCQSDKNEWVTAIRRVGNVWGDGVGEILDCWDVDCRELLDTETVGIGIVPSF